ncbi:MAG: hypothetical protein GY898_10475 [Proteobacteria bacterium]|nr:hypothetical protein [Pseudomonadota bacterium]
MIVDILDAPYPPSVQLSPDGQWMVELERPALSTLDELAAPVVKVAGVKLDPSTRGPSRPYLFRRIKLQELVKRGRTVEIELPEDARIGYLDWHPDGDKFSFTLTGPEGIGLDGASTVVVGAGLIDEASPSPDGQWLLVHTIERPFSYQVPASRFPRTSTVLRLDAPETSVTVADLPLAEPVPVPFGSVRTGIVARLRARPDRATERLSRSFSFGQRAIPASRARSCD